jgi:predicted membrane protein
MNEERFQNKIEERWGKYERRSRRGRVWSGLFLLVVGVLLLLKTMNILFFPAWFFTWPVFLIALGVFIGAKHGFRTGFWIIPVLIGGLFLANQYDPTLRLDRFITPFIIIAIGLIFILKPRRQHWRRWREHYVADWKEDDAIETTTGSTDATMATPAGDRRDFIDVTSVFGGVKKNVLSKSFKGGDIVSFMGGSEINLTQADFTGRVTIDATNIFGGTKLIVPPTWDVQSDITAIFGGVDDKRQISGVNMDPSKVLVLDGVCMFGGIEIRSF